MFSVSSVKVPALRFRYMIFSQKRKKSGGSSFVIYSLVWIFIVNPDWVKPVRRKQINKKQQPSRLKAIFIHLSLRKQQHWFQPSHWDDSCKSFYSRIYFKPSKDLRDISKVNMRAQMLTHWITWQYFHFQYWQSIKLLIFCTNTNKNLRIFRGFGCHKLFTSRINI